MSLMLIPPPLGQLVGMAKIMPKVIKAVKSMATVDEDGTLGIVTSAAEAATAIDVVKLQKQLTEELYEDTTELLRKRESIVNDNYMSEDRRDKKLKRIDEMLDENRKAFPVEVDDATKAALTEANKEKVEPPILAGLAPFTAIIGIPIFLIGLLKYLGPAGSALGVDPSLLVDTSEAGVPKYAEWGAPPEEKSPIKKDGKQWWWTVPPQLPVAQGDGDWTRQRYGGLPSKKAHKKFMKRRYDQ